MPRGKYLTAEQKAEIIRLRIDEGLPVWGIAEKFKISKTAVFSTVSAWKKHGNAAISNDEKEPDTAAPVTDSEQEICEDIPTNIVTQETENVKVDDDLLPCAVVEAIADQIDRLFDTLLEYDRKMQRIKDARDNVKNSLKELKSFLKKNGYGDILKGLASDEKWRALNESANSL